MSLFLRFCININIIVKIISVALRQRNHLQLTRISQKSKKRQRMRLRTGIFSLHFACPLHMSAIRYCMTLPIPIPISIPIRISIPITLPGIILIVFPIPILLFLTSHCFTHIYTSSLDVRIHRLAGAIFRKHTGAVFEEAPILGFAAPRSARMEYCGYSHSVLTLPAKIYSFLILSAYSLSFLSRQV